MEKSSCLSINLIIESQDRAVQKEICFTIIKTSYELTYSRKSLKLKFAKSKESLTTS